MTAIKVRAKESPQKLVFCNRDRSVVVITNIEGILEGGAPIDPDNGDDLDYIGVTTDDVELGVYGNSQLSFSMA